MERLKKGNAKAIHKVTAVRHTVCAEQAGADIIAVTWFKQGSNIGGKVMEESELNAGMALCGLSVRLIQRLVSVKEYIDSIMNQA